MRSFKIMNYTSKTYMTLKTNKKASSIKSEFNNGEMENRKHQQRKSHRQETYGAGAEILKQRIR